MSESREERKSKLRDWMTATIQLDKVSDSKCTSADISYAWRRVFGIKMNEKWVEKALYGKKKECQN
jgi:hypothetical protein